MRIRRSIGTAAFAAALALFSHAAQAENIVYFDSFEGCSPQPCSPATTVGQGFYDNDDFFDRMRNGDYSLGFTPGNQDGEYYFAGRDLNTTFGGQGGENAERSITFGGVDDIDISNSIDVKIQINLAAGIQDQGNYPFENHPGDTEYGDFIEISYKTDLDSDFQQLDFFTFDGPVGQDGALTNGTVSLTQNFQTLTYDGVVPDEAASLIVRLRAFTTAGNEAVAFDRFVVTNNPAPAPEPGSLAILSAGIAVLGYLRPRRRARARVA